jgi:transcriptional regulator with PAS, ATPase and Fis domain
MLNTKTTLVNPDAGSHQHGSFVPYGRNALVIWILDLDTLEFMAVNDAAVRQFGYSRNQYLGMTLKDVVPDSGVTRILEDLKIIPKVITHVGIWTHGAREGYLTRVEVVSHEIVYNERSAIIVLTKVAAEQVQSRTSEQSNARHKRQAVVSDSSDIISRIDRRLQVLGNNREIDGMVGMSWAELQGKQNSEIEIEEYQTPENQTHSCEALFNIQQQLPSENQITTSHAGDSQGYAQRSIWNSLIQFLFYPRA